MKIIYGIKNGALLQRDGQIGCKCFIKAEFAGEVKTSLGKISLTEDNLLLLSSIEAGGPYEIILSDDINKVTLKDIYVGDLWVLAGQSNMEGAGRLYKKYEDYALNPDKEIRAYYMDENWGAALPQLHQLWLSQDEQISRPYREYRKNSAWGSEYPEKQKDGVGPGLFFAKEIKATEKVPQGLIPCGIGGSNLNEWKPNIEGNYYAAMKRRFYECGGNVKGVFWHQGESQANEAGCKNFISDMKYLVSSMREDFNNKSLPFVQVQINKYVAADINSAPYWAEIRDKQRTLNCYIDNLTTVYSLDLELDDLIHLSSDSHEVLGKRAADAMLSLLKNENDQIDICYIEIIPDDFIPFRRNILIKFKNVKGKLISNGLPSGFMISSDEKGLNELRYIIHTRLREDAVIVKTELPIENIEENYICYGYGHNFYCNIQDESGRSIPGFGPVKISDLLKDE